MNVNGLLLPALVLLLGAPSATLAQHGQHEHQQGSPGERVSERARAQIRAVEAAVRHLDTPEAAREAGFRPASGWLPSMGTHWVKPERVRDGFDMLEPDQLMFSPVDGEMTLVGVAYAFRAAADAPMPADAFDGTADRWHDHPGLAPGDATLHMLHVWFVDSPDGPFAGHNPWLPFYAVGLTPPDAAVMEDPVFAERVRAAAAALGTTIGTTRMDRLLERFADPELVERVERHRRAIGGLVPRLRRAQAKHDAAAWDRLVEEAAQHWAAIHDAYLEAAPTERARERLARALDRMTGGPEHH